MRALPWLALALAGLAGCSFQNGFDGTQYRCDESQTCPDGQSCIDDVCVVPSDGGTGGVDASTVWAPRDNCGGLGLLEDDFADGVAGWGTAFPGEESIGASEGQLRALVQPTDSDVRLGYRSRHVYAIADDAIELELGNLAGPGWAGLSVANDDESIELTVTETTARCDRRTGGSVERLTAPREGATRLRIAFHDGRAYCALGVDPVASPDDAGVDAAPPDPWRAVGDHPTLPDPLAEVSVIAGGSAGQSGTAVGFTGINRTRGSSAGWCVPGTLTDAFTATLSGWSLTTDQCSIQLDDGDAVVRQGAATFDGRMLHRHPLDLSSGVIAFELGELGPGTSKLIATGDGEDGRLVVDVTSTELVTHACVGDDCTELGRVDRDVTQRWLGLAATAGGLRVVRSSDAQVWTTVQDVTDVPFDRTATVAGFGASGTDVSPADASYRIRSFVTQP